MEIHIVVPCGVSPAGIVDARSRWMLAMLWRVGRGPLKSSVDMIACVLFTWYIIWLESSCDRETMSMNDWVSKDLDIVWLFSARRVLRTEKRLLYTSANINKCLVRCSWSTCRWLVQEKSFGSSNLRSFWTLGRRWIEFSIQHHWTLTSRESPRWRTLYPP